MLVLLLLFIHNTVRAWDLDTNKLIESSNKHEIAVNCAKFSSHYYCKYRSSVICSSSDDKTIRFWDFKHNQQFQVFNGHTNAVRDIEFLSFNGYRYLCFGSYDKTVRLLNVKISRSLHVFNGHEVIVCCVDISPLQSNNSNSNKCDIIVAIDCNGYTICA
ncbi:F-box and wd40 domain protein [Reticulomyxa filosa]|uniref:F-box and wd40 domain protein n=1 Tax=Reticulomyxa filosa TaxID=46433 RepID=X6MYJ2_RETFI|nr:F-box and wd40 domain protein [Reticulomyxa filosa]|eukprot:ETO18703.1 F-box and wd40 domain protein [Reticulomyxa filosa]